MIIIEVGRISLDQSPAPHRRFTDNMCTSPEAINVSVKVRREAAKIRRRQNRLRERLSGRLTQRVTHNFNEMSPDELRLHDCMVMHEFLRKNPDLMPNLSKHQGLREALESQEVRTTLVKIRSIFVGTSGYNWNWETPRSTPHPLSIVPINSEFHNAELAHIAGKSHRRSAYDLQRARGKQRRLEPIIITPGRSPLNVSILSVFLTFVIGGTIF
jgi:hypothetical protein